MPILNLIENDILVRKVTGSISLKEVRQAYEEATELVGYEPAMNSIWDLREMDISGIKVDLTRSLANFFLSEANQRTNPRSAIVAGSEAAFGLSRVYQAHVDFGPVEVRVFRSMTEAREWVLSPSPEDESG